MCHVNAKSAGFCWTLGTVPFLTGMILTLRRRRRCESGVRTPRLYNERDARADCEYVLT